MKLDGIILISASFILIELIGDTNNLRKKILLVKVGEIENYVIDTLKENLAKIFNRPVEVGKPMEEPVYAYNRKRNQYSSRTILMKLLEEKEFMNYEKVLGIVDHDLYIPELNFVFGEASKRVALISLTRLRPEFYGLLEDRNLFLRRVLTEAVHELGHTFNLKHCCNPSCVMFFSNTLSDTDNKGIEFCPKCKSKFPHF